MLLIYWYNLYLLLDNLSSSKFTSWISPLQSKRQAQFILLLKHTFSANLHSPTLLNSCYYYYLTRAKHSIYMKNLMQIEHTCSLSPSGITISYAFHTVTSNQCCKYNVKYICPDNQDMSKVKNSYVHLQCQIKCTLPIL